MNKYSVLIINWKDIKHPRAGGGTFYTHKIATYLVKNNYKVMLLTAKYLGCKNREFIDGVEVLRVGNLITVYGIIPFKYLTNLRGKFDIIIDEINYIPWFTPFYVRDVPILSFIHQTGKGLLDLEVGKIIKIPIQLAEKITPFVYRNNVTITVSKSVKEELVKNGFPHEKVIIIPPGIEYKKYRVKKCDKSNYPLILYVGRLTKYKGVQYLIKASKYLSKSIPQARISIVGKGNYLKDLIEIRNKLGLQDIIKFHGYVSEEEKIKLMQSSWVLVNPSIREGFGIVVIEAAACGTPTIGTNTTGLKDSIINGKTGMLVPYGEPKVLAYNIFRMIENDDLRLKMSKNAIELAKKFDWDKKLCKYKRVIDNIIHAR